MTDGMQFDTFTSALGRAESRRAALKIFGGAVFGALMGAFHGRGTTVEAQSQPSGSGYLCNQSYALCASASCVTSPSDATMVICRCPVENGYSFGYTTCSDRMPNGSALTSNFSMQGVASRTGIMICNVGGDGGVWASCLDAPCQVDPTDPTQALCQCQSAQTQKYITFGGNCDLASCTTTIWSSATLDLSGIDDYIVAMQQANQPVPQLQFCPPTSTQ
jgi:hypothetical protein